MKKTTVTSVLGISIVIIGMSFSMGPGSECSPLYSAGAPNGVCGDPMGGGVTCHTAGCHSSGPAPVTQTGWITSNVSSAGYTPGATYTLVATATRSGHTKFGFEVSPQSTSGTALGTLVISDATNTQLTSTMHYVTHTLAGTTGTTGFHTWTFNWTAPVSGSGAVTFYGAFNITNANNANTGDTIMLSTLLINENTSAGISRNVNAITSFSLYPNPVSDRLNVHFAIKEASKVEISLMDIHGKTIEILMSEYKGQGTYTQSYTLDRAKYAEGYYFVKVTGGGDGQIKKILIQ